jgi:anti-sigma-K factor RskA
MAWHQHPELLDRLAAAYALGTLRSGARRRFEAVARDYPHVRATAWRWHAHLAGLAELQTAVAPDPLVWQRIQIQLRNEDAAERQRLAAQTPAAPTGWWHRLGWWRGAAATGAFATVVAVVAGVLATQQVRELAAAQIAQLQRELAATPKIQYVAVLQDERDAASMLVTFDERRGQLELQRVGSFREASDRSLQLWALPPSGAPRSLGVLGEDRVLRLPATPGAVRGVPALAISLEPRGGVPSERGPTGPVLFKGALIERML